MKILKFKNHLLNFFSIIFFIGTVYSQKSNIHFEHFSIDQGMHESIVPYIFQDRRGFLWFTTRAGLERFDGYNFLNYQNDPQNPASIDDAFLTTIYEDKSGILWVGTWRGLERFDPVTETFTHYTPHPHGTNTKWSNHITSILEDKTGVLWIGTGEGLNIFDRKTLKFTPIKNDSTNPNSLICNVITVVFEDKEGELWFGTGNGLDKFDRKTKHFTHYFSSPYNQNDFGNWGDSAALLMPSSWITSVFEDEKGIFWIGTWGGLIKFNHKLNTSTFYNHNPKTPTSLGCNKILTICQDVSGILWISTHDHGVDSFNKLTNVFKHFTHDDNDPSSLSNDNTVTVKSERSGTIWITSSDGVNKLNRTSQPFELLLLENIQRIINGQKDLILIRTKKEVKKFDPGTEEFTHHSFVNDFLIAVDNDGALWMCKAEKGGMYKQDALGKITRFYYSSGKEFDHYLHYIYKSSDGIIWIGSDSGLFFIDPVTHYVTRMDNNKFRINSIYEDKYGLFWVGTEMGGLFCYNRNRDTVTQYISNSENHSVVGFSSILDIHEDKNGTLWIAANNGLNKHNRATKSFTNFPGNGAFSILEDDHGKLWLSNRKGISKFDPETNKFKNYDVSYGLPANGFNNILGLKATNGEMYFGGPNGLIRFHPDSVKDNPYIPPIVITAFKKFNVNAKLDSTISEKKMIFLPYFENSISFEFASLNYSSTQKNQYAYKLEGLERNWIYSGTRRFASYPNLEPGKYVFRVKGSNNDGIWNEKGTSIAIIISPPWWKTWWAYTLYAFFFIFSLYGLRRYELNRLSFKNRVKMDEAVLKEKEETDKLKSKFFANISHEFRTPLTLILGPAEKIISRSSDKDTLRDASIVKRNSQRLLQLVNQLLDLSKLEGGKLKLEVSNYNIVSFVKGIALSFESLSEEKDITLKIFSEKDLIEVYFDREKMIKILSNILSNAFKFTPQNGKITIKIREKNNGAEIKIIDTGIGILPEEIPKLFDRFYQVDSSFTKEYQGTGIGLALTKELVELHHGSISVRSEKENPAKVGTGWTEFTLNFPLGRNHLTDEEILSDEKTGKLKELISDEDYYIPERIKKEIESGIETDSLKAEKTIILVVEDNYDMREYIKESLEDDYYVEEALNGEQGVRKAKNIIPDLIISDMMMPKMDGNELTRILKNNEKTSHIPIIILTAKSGQESKLEGLETGADDYLTKPFDIKELQVRIKNLISIRRKLQERFHSTEFGSTQTEISSHTGNIKTLNLKGIDEKFINKVLSVIEEHISEESFSVEKLGNEVGMSKAQFYRKIKALTGMPVSIYLRTVRLAKAKKMIEEKQGNISEIAFSVGFSSPSYFAKCFKEEFGYTPSNFVD